MTWGVGTILDNSSWDLNYFMQTNGTSGIIKIIVIFFIFLWIVSIIRVAKDISHRTHNVFAQIMCILLVTLLSPLIGLPIYLILRPLHYHKDRIPRREAEALHLLNCYNCHTLNLKDNDYCSNCGEPLKLKCKKCWNKCCYSYSYCNECGSPNFDN